MSVTSLQQEEGQHLLSAPTGAALPELSGCTVQPSAALTDGALPLCTLYIHILETRQGIAWGKYTPFSLARVFWTLIQGSITQILSPAAQQGMQKARRACANPSGPA